MAFELDTEGEDSLGKFDIRDFADCQVCGADQVQTVRYHKRPGVSTYVAEARSFLLRANKRKRKPPLHREIGINCGCYSKVHRQIAHIEHMGWSEK